MPQGDADAGIGERGGGDVARSAGRLRAEPHGARPRRRARSADRPHHRAAADAGDPLPAAQEQPGVRRRCRRRQDRARRRAGAAPAAGRRPGGAAGRRGLLARLGRAARRHAVPRRLRGTLQGRHHRAGKRAHADPVHRRDPLDRRRRRHDGRHDGSRDADQAGPHHRPAPRRRLDDARGVQAHREGSRAGAAAAEGHHRRAVDPGDRADPAGAAVPLRGPPSRQVWRRRARGGGEAGVAAPARLPPARQRHRRARRSRRQARGSARRRGSRNEALPIIDIGVPQIEEVIARMARIPAKQASSSDRDRLRDARGVARRAWCSARRKRSAWWRARSSDPAPASASRIGRRARSCSPARPASARPSSRSSSRCTSATSSSATT